MMSVIMMSVIMMSVIMMSVIMMSVIMMSVILIHWQLGQGSLIEREGSVWLTSLY
jgi:hypothetical protein